MSKCVIIGCINESCRVWRGGKHDEDLCDVHFYKRSKIFEVNGSVGIPAICNPDTLYVAAFIDWDKQVYEQILTAYFSMNRRGSLRERAYHLFEFRYKHQQYDDHTSMAEVLTWAQVTGQMNDWIKKQKIEDESSAVPLNTRLRLCGTEWLFYPSSGKTSCHCRLESNGLTIHIRLGAVTRDLANCHVELGSLALWSGPWVATVNRVQNILNQFGNPVRRECVSRVDVAFHCQGIELDEARFVTRAIRKDQIKRRLVVSAIEKCLLADDMAPLKELHATLRDVDTSHRYMRGKYVQGLEWGSRRRLLGRAYVKSREIVNQAEKKVTFPAIWEASGFDVRRDVVNVEFQLMRTQLRERCLIAAGFSGKQRLVCIDTLADLIEHWEVLKAYLVGNETTKGWLRFTDGEKSRKHRSEIDKSWLLLRAAVKCREYITSAKRSASASPTKIKEVGKRAARALVHLYRLKGRVIYLPDDDSEQVFLEKFILEEMKNLVGMYEECRNDKDPLLSDLVIKYASEMGIARQILSSDMSFDEDQGEIQQQRVSAMA